MSNSTDIYDKILAAIPTLTGFNTKTQIPKPYPEDIAENNVNFLREGWGVRVGSSTPNTPTDLPTFTTNQEFEVVLTERVVATQSNSDPLIDVTKKVLNDISTIEIDFTTTRFSIADQVEFVNVSSISAVENVRAGKFNHISIGITFIITHWR